VSAPDSNFYQIISCVGLFIDFFGFLLFNFQGVGGGNTSTVYKKEKCFSATPQIKLEYRCYSHCVKEK